jgi:maltose/moltooligosaccharide transporter
MQKPRLNFWQVWNMSFGFLGIQFGWGLQMANMSAIYKYLGTDDSKPAILWPAALKFSPARSPGHFQV